MENKEQKSAMPVPFERQFKIFQDVEKRVNQHLRDLDHEYFVVGLRVAYDEMDSSNEPGVFPYTVEFGSLGPVDEAARCTGDQELSEEELLAIARNSPIPLEFIDDLLSGAKHEMEDVSGTSLNVSVAIVITGSAVQGYSVSCLCKTKTKKRYCYYNRQTRATCCYCTTRVC